jgi:hypothetical protein
MIDSPQILELSDSEFRLIVSLWCVASTQEVPGTVPMTAAAIRRRILPDHETDAINAMLSHLADLNLISGSSGDYSIPRWDDHQYEYESWKPEARREQKRKERESKKGGGEGSDGGCRNDVASCRKTDTDTDTDLDTESTSRESRAPAPEATVLSLESSPLFGAVLDLTGKTRDYRMGRISPNFRVALAKVVGKLEDDNRTVADIALYRDKLPAFLNKPPPEVTPPQPNQILDNFDRVIAHKERATNDTATSPTARKLGAIYDRQQRRRAEFESRQQNGGTGNAGVAHGVQGRP